MYCRWQDIAIPLQHPGENDERTHSTPPKVKKPARNFGGETANIWCPFLEFWTVGTPSLKVFSRFLQRNRYFFPATIYSYESHAWLVLSSGACRFSLNLADLRTPATRPHSSDVHAIYEDYVICCHEICDGLRSYLMANPRCCHTSIKTYCALWTPSGHSSSMRTCQRPGLTTKGVATTQQLLLLHSSLQIRPGP